MTSILLIYPERWQNASVQRKKVHGIASVANISEITAQRDFLERLLHTNYLEQAGINESEQIRTTLRSLIKYIPKFSIHYDTNFQDETVWTGIKSVIASINSNAGIA